jgi:ferrous iron transport protein B
MSGPAEFTNSFGASLGRAFAPLLKPLGLGDWRVAISLISGIVAKEIVVANIAIVFGLAESASMAQFGEVLGTTFTQLSAYGFLTFVLLYTPCIATVAVIKRETNSWKWTIFSVAYQLVIAWTVAMLIFQIGSLIGL